MNWDVFEQVSDDDKADMENFWKAVDHLVVTGGVRHVATIRCKKTGGSRQLFAPVDDVRVKAADFGILNLTVSVDIPGDDDNIIDPYGSGPVPIEPIRIKTTSHTIDGVKTGLVVGR
ncbi:hypothetical protein [Thalassospira sp. UBA1131]|uniref:hypothetical protein n=1 Tax=Thalassospira sp. UBA1131 TaxID=1947672 RepID=UPI0025E69C74|nr:hypothetical protein [Thalassospira sp. UBA1131]